MSLTEDGARRAFDSSRVMCEEHTVGEVHRDLSFKGMRDAERCGLLE